MPAPQVGFIGLGAMGDGQAKNLIKAGFTVRAFDIDPAAVESVVTAGGLRAASPAEAAREADLLFVLVFTAAQAEAVLFGPEGAVTTLPSGATVVLHTTGRPQDAAAFEARLAESGLLMLDAPVTGGKVGADSGTLTIIASGPERAFAAAEAAFQAMSNTIYRVGDKAGAASKIKMVSQLLVGAHAVAMAEALALAKRAGADLKVVYDVVTHGFGNSAVFERMGPFVLDGDFAPRGVTDIMIKDLGIVLETAKAYDLDLPLSTLALQQYLAAGERGMSRADLTSVIKLYEEGWGADAE
jgi:3-hydroxyisobutyrate dehydrogenase